MFLLQPGFINFRHVGIAVMGLSLIHISFNELGNGSVNDRQVDIAVVGISLRSVMACSTLVSQLSMIIAMVSLKIGILILRLWV